jgi:hypothetical protein
MLDSIPRFLASHRVLLKRKAAAHLRPHAEKKNHEVHRVFSLLLDGYNAGLDTPPDRFAKQAASVPLSERRVLYEAAFAAQVSLVLTGKQDWHEALRLTQDAEPYGVAIAGLGIGAAFSHMRLQLPMAPQIVEQYWGWMAMDAYGFNEGYYRWSNLLFHKKEPEGVSGLGMRAFDQGLGRALYFVTGADPQAIHELIERFPPARRRELWAGLGLMVAYWGALDEKGIRKLLNTSKNLRPHFQQGVALAALLRAGTADVPDHTEGACSIVCQAASSEVASLANSCLLQMNGEPMSGRSYHGWQLDITKTFAGHR